MKINLTKKQYQELLKMAFCGNWVMNARFTKDDPEHQKEQEALYRYIKSLAKDFGLKDWVMFDKVLDAHFLTQGKEFEFHEFVEDYNDHAFWEELEERLVEREFDQTYSKEEQEGMTVKERMGKMCDIEEKYNKEFCENGIDNLKINFPMTSK